MLRSIGKVCFIGMLVLGLAHIVSAQQIEVVPLSTSAANSNFAVSPNLDGVTFIGDSEEENEYLIVIDSDVDSATILTVGANVAFACPTLVGSYTLASPIVRLADGEFSISLVAIPSQDKGTSAETNATQQWATANSTWASARFGWQDSLGDWLAHNVLIPLVGVDNLANASDTTLVVGTTVVVGGVVIGSALAIEVAATGTITWGSGAAAGGAAAGGTAATGTGVSVATSVANGTVQAGGTLEAVLVAIEAQGAGTSIVTSLGNIGTAAGTVGLEAGVLEGGVATATAIANGTATQVVLTQAGGVTTTILSSGEIIITRAGIVILHLIH